MATWNDVREAPFGTYFHRSALKSCCRVVYGAVAWPHRNPGYAVVLAVSRSLGTIEDYWQMVLLVETESFDTRELVRACGKLNTEWEPDIWVGDVNNGSAEGFIDEMNQESKLQFNLGTAYLLNMDGKGKRMSPMYPRLLGMIKSLIKAKQRQLFLKDRKVVNYLPVRPDEIVEIEGTVPAIEALGLAVDEVLRDLKTPPITQTHTEDGPSVHDEGEFDHLNRIGTYDPGPEYDDEDDFGGN